jgi:CheY-like chemotaxis protein
LRILLVEDTIGEPMREVLARWGHTVALATTGAEARRQLQNPGHELFLIDWMLPDASGLDLVGDIRERPEYREAAILMISSRSQRDDILTAIRSGIDGYVAKPFKPAELRERIDEVWQRRRRTHDQTTQVELILQNQERLQYAGSGPLLIFGEEAVTGEDLAAAGSAQTLEYLSAATTVVSAANAFLPSLSLGYHLAGSTGEVTKLLRGRDTARRVQLAMVSARCHGNAVLMARLIDMREGVDGRLCIVYDHPSDLTGDQRHELRGYGVAFFDRRELDAERWRDIIHGQIVSRSVEGDHGALAGGQLAADELKALDRLEQQISPSRPDA